MAEKFIVRLAPEERQQLEDLASKGKTAAYRIKHANILLKADADVTARLSADQLTELFDLGYHMKHASE